VSTNAPYDEMRLYTFLQGTYSGNKTNGCTMVPSDESSVRGDQLRPLYDRSDQKWRSQSAGTLMTTGSLLCIQMQRRAKISTSVPTGIGQPVSCRCFRSLKAKWSMTMSNQAASVPVTVTVSTVT